jgi:putative membrane protein
MSPEVNPWAWHPHADVWLLMFGLVAGYVVAVVRWGPRFAGPGEPPATQREKACYFLGIAALWFAADWPVHDISENYLFSIHMVQHTIFTLVAPPLLILGVPKWMWRRVLSIGPVGAALRALTRPLVALILFNAIVLITHWPTIVNASLGSEPVHFIVHVFVFGSAAIMWLPVVAPVPDFQRLSEPGKMLYLFMQSILPTVPASFLTFSDGVIYSFYEAAPRIWGISAIEDQRMAGLMMKLGGGLLLWIVIAIVFFRWNAKEESDLHEEVRWDDFERELEIYKMRKS